MTALLIASLVFAIATNVTLVSLVADRMSPKAGILGTAHRIEVANRNEHGAMRLAA